MKRQQVYTLQMLARVFDFGQIYAKMFPETSAARHLIASLGSAIMKLGGQASLQVSGTGEIRTSLVSRRNARKALKTKLDLIDQTARALKLSQFYLPRNKTDAAYIAAGKAFARQAKSIKDRFIKQGCQPTSSTS